MPGYSPLNVESARVFPGGIIDEPYENDYPAPPRELDFTPIPGPGQPQVLPQEDGMAFTQGPIQIPLQGTPPPVQVPAGLGVPLVDRQPQAPMEFPGVGSSVPPTPTLSPMEQYQQRLLDLDKSHQGSFSGFFRALSGAPSALAQAAEVDYKQRQMKLQATGQIFGMLGKVQGMDEESAARYLATALPLAKQLAAQNGVQLDDTGLMVAAAVPGGSSLMAGVAHRANDPLFQVEFKQLEQAAKSKKYRNDPGAFAKLIEEQQQRAVQRALDTPVHESGLLLGDVIRAHFDNTPAEVRSNMTAEDAVRDLLNNGRFGRESLTLREAAEKYIKDNDASLGLKTKKRIEVEEAEKGKRAGMTSQALFAERFPLFKNSYDLIQTAFPGRDPAEAVSHPGRASGISAGQLQLESATKGGYRSRLLEDRTFIKAVAEGDVGMIGAAASKVREAWEKSVEERAANLERVKVQAKAEADRDLPIGESKAYEDRVVFNTKTHQIVPRTETGRNVGKGVASGDYANVSKSDADKIQATLGLDTIVSQMADVVKTFAQKPGGPTFRQWLEGEIHARMGLRSQGLAVQAFEGYINAMAKGIAPGSGQVSDRDAENAKKLIPRLWYTQGGALQILETLAAFSRSRRNSLYGKYEGGEVSTKLEEIRRRLDTGPQIKEGRWGE